MVSICSVPSATPPQIEWQQSLGGFSDDSLSTLQQISDGGYVLSGWSGSPPSGVKTSPYYGISDLWVVRLDAKGQILWDHSFGGVAQEGTPCAVRQTRDGGFIVASQSNSRISGNKTSSGFGNPESGYYDLWIIRLDGNGNKLWEASYGGARNEFFGAVEETSDGGFILGGSSDSDVTGTKTSANDRLTDYWLVRLDANGLKLWDRSFGGSGDDYLYALHQTADGGFILGGESWSPVSGNKTSPNHGASDFWVVRVDQEGNKLWEESYGGTGQEILYSLAQAADGGFILGGYSYSGATGNKTSSNFGITDYWVVRTDARGNIVWDKAYGGGGVSVLRSLRTTADGGLVLGGYSDDQWAEGRVGNKTSPSFGSSDFWILRVDKRGDILWDLSLGGTSDDLLFDLQPTTDGGFIVGGEALSSPSGNKTTLSYGLRDYWVVKLAPEDSDADGVPDLHDLCPGTAPGAVVDASGCSLEQICPCDGAWKSHGEYVSCVARAAASFVNAGLITGARRTQILTQAANASCGR